MKRTIERITRTAMLAVAFMLCATSAWAVAPEPTAVWESGQFEDAASSHGGYSITLPTDATIVNGNIVLAGTEATGAVIDVASVKSGQAAVSVLIKYSGVRAPTKACSFVNTYVVGTSDSFDMHAISKGATLYLQGAYNKENNSNNYWQFSTGPQLGSSGYFLFTYNNGAGTGGYAGNTIATLSGGTNSGLKFGSRTISKVGIGGPTGGKAANATYPTWDTGVTIEAVALFVGQELSLSSAKEYYFPSEDPDADYDYVATISSNTDFDDITTWSKGTGVPGTDARVKITSQNNAVLTIDGDMDLGSLSVFGGSITLADGASITSTTMSGADIDILASTEATITNSSIANKINCAGKLTTDGTTALNGANSITGELVVGGTKTTLCAASSGLAGTITINEGAQMDNVITDALAHGGSATVNVSGTLNMGSSRWTLGANNTINLLAGGEITGSGEGSNGALDAKQAVTINIDDTSTLSAKLRTRGNITLNVIKGTLTYSGGSVSGYDGYSIVKTGAGTIESSVAPINKWSVSAGKVVQTAFPGYDVTIADGATFTLKNVEWPSDAAAGRFSGSGTLELDTVSAAREHKFLGSSFTGKLRVVSSGEGDVYHAFAHVGAASFTGKVFTGRPEFEAAGDVRIYHSTSTYPFTIKNLSGSGYFKNYNTYDSNVYKYVDTEQTANTTYSGVFAASSHSVGDPSLTVRGADDATAIYSLTLSGASDTTAPLTIENKAKVVFASTGKWSGGTVTVKDGGVLESQNSAVISPNLKVEEGATLKFASGVELLASNYDWTSVSTDESVNIDLSAVAPSATPITLIASGVTLAKSKFAPVNEQEPVELVVEDEALKVKFTNNRFVDGDWAVGPESGHDTIVTLSDSATMSIASNMSLGAITVETTTDDPITLTVSGAGSLTATSISLPANVTLKIAKDGEWTVPISGAGAIEIGSGITATINAAVTTSGGFVVGDNATLTVAYANISSSTGAFSGGSTSTVKMALALDTTNIAGYQNLNSLWKFNDSSSWRGAVEISGAVGVFGLKQFGNTSSKVIVNGLSSYATSTGYNSVYDWNKVGTLEIGSGGWTINGSYSGGKIDLRAAVVGSGTITSTATGTNGCRIFFTGDMSGFEGSLAFGGSAASQFQVLNTTETDPTSDTKCVDYVEKTIVIASDSSAAIGSSATWTASGGLYVKGTLAFAGDGTFSGDATTYSGASLDFSDSDATPAITGELTLGSGTTFIFPALNGAADYQLADTLSEDSTGTVTFTIGTNAYRAPCAFTAETGMIEFPALATLNGGDTPIAWSSIAWDAKPTTIDGNTSVFLTILGNTTLTIDETVAVKELVVQGGVDKILTLTANGGSFVASTQVDVKGGVLRQGSASVLGATPLIVVEDGATFDMNGFSVNVATAAYIAGAGAGNWPWALTSSSGAFAGTIQNLTLFANATIGGQYQIVLGRDWAGSNGNLGGYTLTKTGVGELYVKNFNTPQTGRIVISEGTLTTAQWNCLNKSSGTTALTIADGATVRAANQEANPPAVTELNWDGTLNTASRHFIVKNTLNGGGSTAYLNFEANATANLKRNLNVTSKLTLAGAMTFLKHSEAENDVVVDVSGSLAASGAISVGAGVTLKLGTNRPTSVITVADGGTLAVKQLNATDVIELATSAQPASVVLYDASGEEVSNKRVTYSDGKLTIMLSKPTLEASGTVAFDTALNWVGSTMPEANGDAIIELLGNAEITVASDYSLGNLTITGSGEVSFSGAGSVSAANIYLKNGATLSRNVNISATTGISLDSGTVLKLNGLTESAVISGAGSVETYGDVTMSAANTFTGGITAKSGTLSTTTTSGFGKDKSGSGYSELSLITVEDGACVDLNNTKDHCYALTIAGNGVQLVNGTYSGAVKNTGPEMGYGSRQTASLTLTSDAMVDVSSGWGLVQNGHNEAYLKLNGHVLTFRGSGTVPMVRVTAANSGTLIFDRATLLLSNYASNFNGVDIIVKGCSSINLTSAPSALGSLTLKPTASGTTASAWNLPSGFVPAVDTSNVDYSGFSDGDEITLFTAPGGTTLTSSTISAQVNGRYTATVSGNTVTATFNAGLPTKFLHYGFNENTAAAADSSTYFNVGGEGGSPSYVDSRNDGAVQVHTGYTPYWNTYANGLSPFHEGNVSVTTAAKIGETGVILWGLGGAAANLAVGLVVTDAHTAEVVARKGTSTVETLATATVTQDLTSGWHFFAIVSDENGTTLYVDHTTASSANGIPTGIGQQGQLGSFHGGAIGASKVGDTGYYLDDWRVYDTKLTEEEVTSLRRALVPFGTIFSVY